MIPLSNQEPDYADASRYPPYCRLAENYAAAAHAKGFVVGVSGGIDSAVVSAIAARTGLKVLLLEMPIRQKADQVSRAQEHIRRLEQVFPNVSGMRVDLTPTSIPLPPMSRSMKPNSRQTARLPTPAAACGC